MNTLTEENYLKCIYKIWESSPEEVYTNSIAAEMKTKSATVTDMLQKLSEKKLLNYEKYYGVTLTEKGKKTALAVIRKHRLWEKFLVDVLKFRWDEVHPIAEQLEHIQSEELIDRLDKFLGHPKNDPHGDPIPDTNGKISSSHLFPLSQLKQKAKAVIAGVAEHSVSFLQYLEKNNLIPGSSIRVMNRHEFDQSVDLKINNKKSIHISNDIAKHILVKVS